MGSANGGKCKLWDDDPEKKIYHCDDCGICRIGAGLGKDFFHCKVSHPTFFSVYQIDLISGLYRNVEYACQLDYKSTIDVSNEARNVIAQSVESSCSHLHKQLFSWYGQPHLSFSSHGIFTFIDMLL